MHMRSRRRGVLCLALLAAWLGALLLSAAAAAAESLPVEDDWAAAQKSLYAAAERYRGTYLKLGDITTAPEMTRIFDMYIAPTATREEARRCFAQGFTGEKAGSTYVSMPYLRGIPMEAWGEIVGERIRRADPDKSPVFPLNQETKDRLTALGLSPKTTLCKYIWVPNYEYAAYAFYSPDRKTWAFLVESLGMMMSNAEIRRVRNYHTALKPGKVYSSGEVRDDLLANVNGAFFLDEWESLIQDYYRDAEKFAAVKIEWETPSNAREGYIQELDRAHVTPYYRLKIETRQDAENLLRAYRPGNLSQFLEQDGYVMPFWSMETTWADNQGRQGDGILHPEKGGTLELEEPYLHQWSGYSYRNVVFGPDAQPMLNAIRKMGFAPETTKALSMNIPYFSDGILFYDGEKEAFVSTYYRYVEAFYQGLPVDMGEMVRWYGENARYLIPDESGRTEDLTLDFIESWINEVWS